MRRSPGIINAQAAKVATTTAPGVVEVLLLDAEAQVPPSPSASHKAACDGPAPIIGLQRRSVVR